jgi:hypothetical protein
LFQLHEGSASGSYSSPEQRQKTLERAALGTSSAATMLQLQHTSAAAFESVIEQLAAVRSTLANPPRLMPAVSRYLYGAGKQRKRSVSPGGRNMIASDKPIAATPADLEIEEILHDLMGSGGHDRDESTQSRSHLLAAGGREAGDETIRETLRSTHTGKYVRETSARGSTRWVLRQYAGARPQSARHPGIDSRFVTREARSPKPELGHQARSPKPEDRNPPGADGGAGLARGGSMQLGGSMMEAARGVGHIEERAPSLGSLDAIDSMALQAPPQPERRLHEGLLYTLSSLTYVPHEQGVRTLCADDPPPMMCHEAQQRVLSVRKVVTYPAARERYQVPSSC